MNPTKRESVLFRVGGMAEESDWQITCDYSYNPENVRCPHVCERAGVLVCPRVVISYTQAGHDHTAVCLDCILDAAAGL